MADREMTVEEAQRKVDGMMLGAAMGSFPRRKTMEEIVWDYLGTHDPALLAAWFAKLQTVARAQGTGLNFEVIDGPITWETVA